MSQVTLGTAPPSTTVANQLSVLSDSEIEAQSRQVLAAHPNADPTKSEAQRLEEIRSGMIAMRELAKVSVAQQEAERASAAAARQPRDLRNEVAAAIADKERCASKREQQATLERVLREGPTAKVDSWELEHNLAPEIELLKDFIAKNCS